MKRSIWRGLIEISSNPASKSNVESGTKSYDLSPATALFWDGWIFKNIFKTKQKQMHKNISKRPRIWRERIVTSPQNFSIYPLSKVTILWLLRHQLNFEAPTKIWIFEQPSKSQLQRNISKRPRIWRERAEISSNPSQIFLSIFFQKLQYFRWTWEILDGTRSSRCIFFFINSLLSTLIIESRIIGVGVRDTLLHLNLWVSPV